MAPMTPTPGQKLRTKMNAALARAAKDAGVDRLELTEQEEEALVTACQQADWIENLAARRDAELAGQARPTSLTRLSAELRHCERLKHDMLAKIRLEPPKAKSAAHQYSANQRWHRPASRA